MIILGIDPGLANTGWAVVEFSNNRYRPFAYGTITTKANDDLQNRICTITNEIGSIAKEFKVEVASIEDVFFTKNVSSAIPVAKVIGAILHQLAILDIKATLFSPPQIKSAITGFGNADKRQVQEMVKVVLGLKEIPRPDHAADALADCVCYATYNETLRK